MRTATAVGAVLISAACSATAAVAPEQAPAAQALPVLEQQLYDALAPGDKQPWLRDLSDRFVQTDESGAVLDKARLMADFHALPPGLSGTIAVEHAQVSDFGRFAVIRYDLDENEQVYDQKLHVRYRATDTWQREQGRWRMVASQIMTLAQDPPPLPLNTAALSDYVGVYDLSGQRRYRVERRGDALVYGRDGGELAPLIPLADNVFVQQSDPLAIQYIFLRGADGKVQGLISRRKFADLRLNRMAGAAVAP
jgi:hypothetical protein